MVLPNDRNSEQYRQSARAEVDRLLYQQRMDELRGREEEAKRRQREAADRLRRLEAERAARNNRNE